MTVMAATRGCCGGDSGSSMRACGDGGGGGNGSWTPSSIFLEHSLEREFTRFFLQMTARVCGGGGSLPLLQSRGWAERGKGSLEAHKPNSPTYNRIKRPQRVGFLSEAQNGGSTNKPKGEER